jgi:hypothetical protein
MNMMRSQHVFSQWEATKQRALTIIIDGETLTLARTATLGRYGGSATLTQAREVLDRIDACVAVLSEQLNQGKTVYGKYRTLYHCPSEGLNQMQGSTQDTVEVRMFAAAMARCTNYN